MHVIPSPQEPTLGKPSAVSPQALTWVPDQVGPAFHPSDILELIREPRSPVAVVEDPQSGHRGLGTNGQLGLTPDGWPVLAQLPAMYPEWLGDRGFAEVHRVRYPYVTGAMANGIATVALVKAAAEHGFLGFFGAAGLSLVRVESAIQELLHLTELGLPWGSNLIHSPNDPALEEAIVDMYLRYRVQRVSASAYMSLTPALVRYAVHGLHVDSHHNIQRTNYIFAKISRPEVAARFLEPPPQELLKQLVEGGLIQAEEAQLAQYLPLAEDITVESDSGGHTDNQALGALFPTIARLRDQKAAEHSYPRSIRLGAAGGIGAPSAAASAFGLGAAYILTGSVNQAAVESGLGENGRKLLAMAELADVTMAPAADMFEMGVDVQVLKRGTLFAQRGHLLRSIYRRYPSLEAIDQSERVRIETACFHKDLETAWADTAKYWAQRDPNELARAEREPKHKMALLFRAYLGQASRWAIDDRPDRQIDYQIWCGPAMGAFNHWVKGSYLESVHERTVGQIGLNLLEGATVIHRAHQLRALGVSIPPEAFDYYPRPLAVEN